MSDWQIGDKAVCVTADSVCGLCFLDEGDGPTAVGVYAEVVAVIPSASGPVDLITDDDPEPVCSCTWRKIRPDVHEGEREDWNLLLDSVKPARVRSTQGEA